jgi:hypothetical protein
MALWMTEFELVILKNLDLVVLGKFIGNMPLDSVDVEISTDKATVSTNVPVSFQIDGEYCGSETNLNIDFAQTIKGCYFKYKQWYYLNGLRSCHGVSGSR